jgi:hypothetical protein
MKNTALMIIAVVIGAYSCIAAKSYFVATSGQDANDGTSAGAPLKTIPAAIVKAAPGDTIYIRAGTHLYDSTISLSKSGTASALICLFAYPGEKPVLDFSAQPYASSNRAFYVSGSYWHLKGLEICNAGDNGIKVEGNYNIIERCVLHHNGDGGIQLGFGHQTVNPDGTLCCYNQIINCDSYRNFDFDSKGGDADGFACKMHNGKGNVFRGCRAWENSDDGWDLFETDWPVEIVNCWTWHNGDQTLFDSVYQAKMGVKMSSFSGNGNGFKLGGDGSGGNSTGTHIVHNCVAFESNYGSKKGFDQNSHKGGVIVHNCLSFNNGYNYMFEQDPNSGCVNEFKNDVSLTHTGAMEYEFSAGTLQSSNSWNLTGIIANAADFKSLDVALAKAPRQGNGDLPDNDFAKLVSGSDLIDKGVDVGLPFTGVAPDLGAYEFGAASGINWQRFSHQVSPRQIGQYAGSYRIFNAQGKTNFHNDASRRFDFQSLMFSNPFAQGVYFMQFGAGTSIKPGLKIVLCR